MFGGNITEDRIKYNKRKQEVNMDKQKPGVGEKIFCIRYFCF